MVSASVAGPRARGRVQNVDNQSQVAPVVVLISSLLVALRGHLVGLKKCRNHHAWTVVFAVDALSTPVGNAALQ